MEKSFAKFEARFALTACWVALTAACGSNEQDAVAWTWKGEEPHLEVRGHLNGEDLDIKLPAESATDPSRLWCGREYAGPPDGNGDPDITRSKLYKLNVYALVTAGGEERRLELEFKPHDFQVDAVPTTVTLIPRVDGASVPSDATWLDFEWHTPDGEGDLLESSAQVGAFRLELYSGEPGADGLMIPEGEGSFGGTLDARWSESEHLEVSVSAPCTENELDLE